MGRLTMGVAVATLAGLVSPGTAGAQSNNDLANLLPQFFSPSRPVILAATGHSAHFGNQPIAQSIMTSINRGIATQLATFPVGSSSGGFAFTFDPSLGVFNRTTQTFGPSFAERANTAGKGKVSFGVNYVRSSFDAFEGLNLHNGDPVFFLRHADLNRDGTNLEFYFEGDIIRANLFLDLNVDTVTSFFNYGVSDKLDVGLAVPLLRIDMTANVRYTIEHLATAHDSFVLHTFGATGDIANRGQSGRAEGIGDLLVRAKYRPWLGRGFAVAADVRLPTGDEEQLLGAGATQAKLFAIASGMGERFSPHVNLGYTASWGGSIAIGELPDEINYTVGFDTAVFKRLTVSGDIIGRTLLNTERITRGELTYEFRFADSQEIQSVVRPDLGTQRADLNTLLAAIGFKFNPFGRLLISGNALFNPGQRGLQDFFTPVVSIDYTF